MKTTIAVLLPKRIAPPSGHALIKSSDGALHHIPMKNIEKARGIDPKLQVIHVAP